MGFVRLWAKTHRDRVDWLAYSGPSLDLEAVGLLNDAWQIQVLREEEDWTGQLRKQRIFETTMEWVWNEIPYPPYTHTPFQRAINNAFRLLRNAEPREVSV